MKSIFLRVTMDTIPVSAPLFGYALMFVLVALVGAVAALFYK